MDGSVRPQRQHLIALVVVVALIALAKWASAALTPVALGLFAICVTWPIFTAVRQRSGQVLAALASLAAFLLGVTILAGLLSLAGWRITQEHEQIQDGIEQVSDWLQQARAWVGASAADGSTASSSATAGAEASAPANGGSGIDVGSLLAWVAEHAANGAEGLALAAAIQLLLLLEWHRLQGLMAHWDSRDQGQRIPSAGAACLAVRRYFYVRTVVGLITGIAVWVACLGVGLELALIYGVLNFGLNYFPTIGSLLGVVPPVVLAVATTGDPLQGLLALAVVGGVQLLMGTIVDPLMQGWALSCSSALVLIAVIAGGWVGGVAGAFLGVPVLLAVRSWAGGQGGRPWLAEAICLPERPRSEPPPAG